LRFRAQIIAYFEVLKSGRTVQVFTFVHVAQ
jgi:hypothetical protein